MYCECLSFMNASLLDVVEILVPLPFVLRMHTRCGFVQPCLGRVFGETWGGAAEISSTTSNLAFVKVEAFTIYTCRCIFE